MPNTADYLTQLRTDRDDFADFLDNNGVPATHSDTITALVAKLPNLPIGGGGSEQTIDTKTTIIVGKLQSIVKSINTNATISIQ